MPTSRRKQRPRIRMSVRHTAAAEKPSEQTGRKRLTASLAISIVAILISALSFGVPFLERYVTQHGRAEIYLANLATSGVSTGEYFAETGSPAHEFARYIRLIEYAAQDDPIDYQRGKALTIASGMFEGPRFTLCFPDREMLPLGCGEARAFEFSSTGKVTDFIWNGLPISAFMNLNPRPMDFAYSTGIGLKIDATAGVRAPNPGDASSDGDQAADGIQLLRLSFDQTAIDTVQLVSAKFLDESGNGLDTAWRYTGGLAGYLAVAGDSDTARQIVICFLKAAQGDDAYKCVSLPAAW